MRNASGPLVNSTIDVMLNPSADIYPFNPSADIYPLSHQNGIKECYLFLGDLRQVLGGHKSGTNEVVPNSQLWMKVLGGEMSMRLSCHCPGGAAIYANGFSDHRDMSFIVQQQIYVIRAGGVVVEVEEAVNCGGVVFHLFSSHKGFVSSRALLCVREELANHRHSSSLWRTAKYLPPSFPDGVVEDLSSCIVSS